MSTVNEKQSNQIKIASFSVLCLCLCALLVFLTQRQGQNLSSDQYQALKRADIYAARLIEKKFLFKDESGQSQASFRGLASVEAGPLTEVLEGPVGIDPWGYSFNYMVKKDQKNNNKGTLVIWSGGANNKLETSRDMIAKDHLNFTGDDFGKSYAFEL